MWSTEGENTAPAIDKIEKSVLVHSKQIAGVVDRPAWNIERPQDRRNERRFVPIAFHYVRAANDELADGSARHAAAPIVHDEHLAVGNGDADRSRTLIDLIWRQVRDAVTFGLTVHRIHLGLRKCVAQTLKFGRRERRSRVRDVPEVRKTMPAEIVLEQQRRDGGNERQAGDSLARHRVENGGG